LGLADALDELVVGEVEGGVLVGRGGLRAHDRPRADERQLDAVVVRGAAALVVAHELHLEREGAGREVLDLGRLLGDVVFEAIRDPDVSSGDGDIHGDLPDPARSAAYGSGGRLLHALPPPSPGPVRLSPADDPSPPGAIRRSGVAAIATAPTTSPPAARIARAASARVAPVVTTSSTSSTRRPSSRPRARCTPCRLSCRSVRPSAVCCACARAGASRRTAGSPVRARIPRTGANARRR